MQVGIDSFAAAFDENRREFLDSAPAVILGAAAARTQRIRLTSAVTVLSAEDPVRAFQHFATLDLLSRGRAEMIVGRGSSIEAFPLFGFRLEDYDALFEEKLNLLLTIREHAHVHWTGKYRAPLTGQGVYPRPMPLMVAIIGGEPRRFRPLIDLYRETRQAARAFRGSTQGRPPHARLCRRHYAGGCRHLRPWVREGDEGPRQGARVAAHDAGALRRAARS